MAKKLTLAVVGVLAVVFWYFAKAWVYNPYRLSETGLWLRPLILMLFLISVTAVALILLKSRKWQLAVAALVTLPAFIFFGLHWLMLTGFAISVLLYWHAIKVVDIESRERIKVNIGRTIHRALRSIIFPILIIVSFAYYLTPAVQQSAKKQEVSATFTKVVYKTIDTFFASELKNLPAGQRQQVKSQVAGQVTGMIQSLIRPYARFMPPLLAFGLFLLLESLSFVFIWIGTFLADIIFWALKRAKLVVISSKQVEIEVLETF
ncbi:MAG: hypothetical protein A2750_04020 [Candidatus Yanofskybacteria bacterium RIFCSPHIGHO2_01_FULL_45_42]|nr:MAG: hypothetical protein A2750_04020 [Candidatus Yanofskybacteria bacterium RIFCSPHIGHO2_01_FULL_45_42]OGN32143.1 MAG: hypothetical protein A3J01_00930 [Candidatus Yanofskybacteria bacterium RIFCSPLOWO2_02_FULL_45_18]